MRYSRRDVLTPANAITAAGLVITVVGAIWLYQIGGLLTVFIGRLLDLVDGPVARATRVTPFSIIFDPIADKLALLAIVISVIAHQLVPIGIIGIVVLENLVIAGLSARAHTLGEAVGAVIPGKLNIFFLQGSVLLFVLARVLDNGFSPMFEVLAYTNLVCSVPFGIMAIRTYARQGIRKTTTAK